MAYISRDPFAREELHREAIETRDTCDFCGNTRKDGKLFQYRIEKDGSRFWDKRDTIKGLFCSIGCMVAYHGR